MRRALRWGSNMLDASSHTAARRSPFYGPEHEAFRATIRRFVEREIEPFATQWDEAGEFPRELYAKAAEVGLIGLGFPAEYGGVECDRFMRIMATQEFARAGSGGVSASLFSHSIGAPPILRRGSAELKARVLPQILSGREDICACYHRTERRVGRRQFADAARAAKASISSSTARRRSSLQACAPTISPSPCAPAAPAWAASACC